MMSVFHGAGEDVMSTVRRNGGLMAGKRGLVMGVANHRSIAWGIARQLEEHGAELAYSYYSSAIRDRILSLLVSHDSPLLIECDVRSEASMRAMFDTIELEWGSLDFLVHAIAYAPTDEFKGRFIDTSAEAFRESMDVSCYSLTALSRLAEPLLNDGASVLTISYFGSQRVVPHYNVMGIAKAALEAAVRYLAVDLGERGIRVNAISAGPIKTLAAAGIGDFREALKWCATNSPLRRSVTIDEVGGAAVFLLSDLGSAVTGATIYVDSGYNVMGMRMLNEQQSARNGAVREVLLPVQA
jgi:enoyl-[acyl-carrier protein] reductase I